MTFRERFKLMSQGIVENDAHLTYLGSMRRDWLWCLKLKQYPSVACGVLFVTVIQRTH